LIQLFIIQINNTITYTNHHPLGNFLATTRQNMPYYFIHKKLKGYTKGSYQISYRFLPLAFVDQWVWNMHYHGIKKKFHIFIFYFWVFGIPQSFRIVCSFFCRTQPCIFVLNSKPDTTKSNSQPSPMCIILT